MTDWTGWPTPFRSVHSAVFDGLDEARVQVRIAARIRQPPKLLIPMGQIMVDETGRVTLGRADRHAVLVDRRIDSQNCYLTSGSTLADHCKEDRSLWENLR